MGFLQGKKALVVGIANQRSIAYGIAAALHREGATLALTYQNEKLQSRVEKMAQEEFNQALTLPCDVSQDREIEALFAELKSQWQHLDIIIHSVAFAPASQLAGDYVDCVNREDFLLAHDISSYSLSALAKAGYPLMEGRHGAIVAMSYLGAQRAIDNYNTMGVAKASLEANIRYLAASLGPKGIRVNGISAGPIRTLAASGVKNLKHMLAQNESITPLRENVTIEQVGNTAAFLSADLSLGITGEILYVDAGAHILGPIIPKEPA